MPFIQFYIAVAFSMFLISFFQDASNNFRMYKKLSLFQLIVQNLLFLLFWPIILFVMFDDLRN